MEALKTYSLPMIVAVAIAILIQALKDKRIPINIPAQAQPYVAIGLSVVAAMAARVIQMGIEQNGEVNILRALLEGLGAGLTSIGLFETAKHAKPQPPPQDPPSGSAAPPSTVVLPPNDPFSSGPVLRVAFATLCAVALVGCGAVEKVQHVVQMSSEVIARAEPCLMLQYEQAQVKCLDLPSNDARRECVDSVKVTWKPIIDALGELRDVRCGLEPQKCQ